LEEDQSGRAEKPLWMAAPKQLAQLQAAASGEQKLGKVGENPLR